MFKELKNGSNRKVAQSLGSLIANRHDDLDDRKKIENLIKKFVQKQEEREKIVVEKLKQNNNECKDKERRERERVRNLLSKIFKRLVTKPFYRLIENSLVLQKRDSDMRTVLKSLEMSSKLKTASNLHEMNRNALKDMFDRFHKKKIIERIIQQSGNKKR